MRHTRKIYFLITFFAGILLFSTANATTNCDSQPKPALDCPTGYSMMCIPVGGDHWGCGKEQNGQIIETNPLPPSQDQVPPDTQTQTPLPPAGGQVEPPPPSNTDTASTSDVQDTTPSPDNLQTVTPETNTTPPAATNSSQNSVSSVLRIVSYVAPLAALAFFFWFGWREWLKRKKGKALPAEKEGEEKTVCETCGGSGKVTKKRIKSVPCDHCKRTGKDICHYCGGTGRYGVGLTVPQTQEEVESMMKCDYCEGTGFKNPVLPCCMCKGKRKIEVPESYEETCPTCGGSGHK